MLHETLKYNFFENGYDKATPERQKTDDSPSKFKDKAQISNDKKPSINDFRIEQTIGVGSFGKVVLAFNLKRNEYSALKVIAKDSVESMKYSNHILTELRVMHELKEFQFPGVITIKS